MNTYKSVNRFDRDVNSYVKGIGNNFKNTFTNFHPLFKSHTGIKLCS